MIPHSKLVELPDKVGEGVIVGSPVYVGNMSGQVKTFFANWGLKFGLGTGTGKMRNKVGAAFATGGGISSGKEITMLTILGAMLIHQMIVISGGGGFGASAKPALTRRASTRRRSQKLATWASALRKSPLLSNGDLASNAAVSSNPGSNALMTGASTQ